MEDQTSSSHLETSISSHANVEDPESFKDFSEFKLFCISIENGLKNESNPSSHFQKCIRQIQTLKTGEINVAQHRTDCQDFFLRIAIPKYVQNILARGDFNNEIKPTINNLLSETLELIISHGIPNDFIELLQTLSRILSNTVVYYASSKPGKGDPIADKSRKEFLETDQNDSEKQKLCVARIPKTDNACIYFIDMINHFGRKGGFATILRRINEFEKKPLSLFALRMLLRPLVNIKTYLSPNFLDDFVPRLQADVFSCLLSASSNDLKKEEKSLFTEIGHLIQELLLLVWPDSKIEDQIERFNLDIALKSFLSSSLDRRLKGIKFIRKMVTRAQLKEDKMTNPLSSLSSWLKPASTTQTSSGGSSTGSSLSVIVPSTQAHDKPSTIAQSIQKPIDPKFLCSWLKDNSVVENLCKLSSHPEMVKQGLPIFVFLAKQNQLDASHLVMLWEGTLGKHESVKHTVFTTLVELLPFLIMEIVEIMFEQARKTPFSDYDNETLSFLNQFVIVLAKRSTEKDKGMAAASMSLLFQLAVQHTQPSGQPASDSISDKAASYFIELLKRGDCAHYRSIFIDLCVENIKTHKLVPQSMLLLIRIIGLYVPGTFSTLNSPQNTKLRKRTKTSASNIIESVEQKHHLLSAVFEDIISFNSNSSAHLPSRYGYLQQIQIRLSFLEFLLSNSALLLSMEQVYLLWDTLIGKNPEANLQAAELALLWIGNIPLAMQNQAINIDNDSMSFVFFSEAVGEALFSDKMTNSEILRGTGSFYFSKNGFAVFDRYFIHVNGKHHKIKKFETKMQPQATKKVAEFQWVAVASELNGIKNLWQIALQSHDNQVSKLAIDRLNGLYQNFFLISSTTLDKDFKTKLIKAREDYLGTAITHLSTISKSVGLKDAEFSGLELVRLLGLIKEFIVQFGKKQDMTQAFQSAPTNANNSTKAVLNLLVKVEKGISYMIQATQTDTIKILRYRMAEHMNEHPQSFKIFINDKELAPTQESKSLQDLKIADRAQLVLKMKQFSIAKKEPAKANLSEINDDLEDLDDEECEAIFPDVPSEKIVIESLATLFRGLGVQSSYPLKPNTNESMPLQSCPAEDQSLQMVPELTISQNQIDHQSPAAILGTKENFDQFYDLLNANLGNTETNQKVWEILQLIPVRNDISVFHQLKDLPNNLEWSNIFDPEHMFKLIYSLQILQTFVSNQGEQPEHWATNFVQKGGLSHLLSIFMSITIGNQDVKDPLLVTSQTHAKCFSLLLQVINFFTQNQTNGLKEDLVQILQADSNSGSKLTFRIGSSMFDIDAFHTIGRLVDISWKAADGCSMGIDCTSSASAVQESLLLLQAIVQHDAALLDYLLFKFEHLPNWISSLLLRCPEPRIRQACSKMINIVVAKLVARDDVDIQGLGRLLDILISFVDSLEMYRTSCQHYFNSFNDLLHATANKQGLTISKWTEVMHTLIKLLQSHPVTENNASSDADEIIMGVCDVISSLFEAHPALKQECTADKGSLIRELFSECLFGLPTSSNRGIPSLPKCKTNKSRTKVFHLLLTTINPTSSVGTASSFDYVKDNFLELVELIHKQWENLARIRNDWSYSSGDRERSPYGYVGLINLGATCYLNSLIQQLYLIPEFRSGVLSASIAQNNSESSVSKTKGTESSSLLYQLQVLFGYLQESAKKYYDTTPFCSTIRDFEGRPINTSQQMDCNEFGNMLFDKLEQLLKATNHPNLLQSIFAGTLCNQLICKECPHSSETEEPFYTLSLEVSRQKNIHDSLKSFVNGEMLVGENKYLCETCSKRVDTLKRCVIKTLPNTLLIHLKRFEFDYEKMRHIKLNDMCEFPMKLNLESYTKEGIAAMEQQSKVQAAKPESQPEVNEKDGSQEENGEIDKETETPPLDKKPASYYEYELVGIVVHTGTADYGHYYSFIKERMPTTGNERKWYEFNDTHVLPFDPENIPFACFGGYEVVTEYDRNTGRSATVNRVKNYNAYILVYQRSIVSETTDTPAKITIPNNAGEPTQPRNEEQETLSPVECASLEQLQNATETNSTFIQDQKPPLVPPKITDLIWKENSDFILEKNAFNLDYFRFIWDVSNVFFAPHAEEELCFLSNLKLCLRFLVDLYAHSREKPILDVWSFHIRKLLKASPNAPRWMLSYLLTERRFFKQMFLHCPVEKVRTVFADVVSTAIQLASVGSDYFDSSNGNGTTLASFVQMLLTPSMLKSVRRHSRHFTQYFQLLKNFAQIGIKEREFLQRERTIARLIDFTLSLTDANTTTSNKLASSPASTASTSSIASVSSPNASTATGLVQQINLTSASLSLRMNPQNLSFLLDVVSLLVRSYSFVPQPPPTQMKELVQNLHPDDDLALQGKHFFARIIKETVNLDAATQIVIHLSWENQYSSKMFTSIIKDGIGKASPDQLKFYFQIVSALLDMKDSHQIWRIDLVLSVLVKVLELNVIKKEFADEFVKNVISFANTNDQAKIWIWKHKTVLSDILVEAGYKFS